MPVALSPSVTASLYGDSISDFNSFGTYNQSLYRTLSGTLRFAQNTPLLTTEITGGRPGWDLAIAGTTVTAITERFVSLVAQDEADVVFVLMGANNYGSNGPGTGTPQDWMDRALDIVAAAEAAGKLLVFVPPISHHNDPIEGRDTLREFLPTLASDRVIVPDVSGFDWRVHTNDGVHPNALGGQFLADAVTAAIRPWLPAEYDLGVTDDATVNLVTNGDLAGTNGILVNEALGYTTGEVADGWILKRIGTSGTVTAQKGTDEDGRATQVLSYDGKGEVRLTQTIDLNGIAGEQYEVAVKITVTDPGQQFLGFRAWDGDTGDGVRLFDTTETLPLASGGTGSYETVLRSSKFVLTGNESSAVINLSAYFGAASGASVEIGDVVVRRVEGTTRIEPDPVGNNDGPQTLFAGDTGQSLYGFGGNDTLYGGLGSDILDGGTGDDVMFGGGGDDHYIVDSTLDKVYETPTTKSGDARDQGGHDTVESSVSYSIYASATGLRFIEDLTLTGTAAINATGNDLGNVLTGNGAANTLNGKNGDDTLIGGGGADILIGGGGADTFVFDAPRGGRDTINDFQSGLDRLALNRDAFSALADLPAGPLDPQFFAIGKAATTADQHFIYNALLKTLFYDEDGSGSMAAIAVVKFVGTPTVSAGDFVLI